MTIRIGKIEMNRPALAWVSWLQVSLEARWHLGELSDWPHPSRACYFSGMRSPGEEPLLRDQLVGAQAAIRRQLELLRNPFVRGTGIGVSPAGGPPDNRLLIAGFERQLSEIELAISA